MLIKTTERPAVDPPEDEETLGDLTSRLIDDSKAYAQAEVDLVKATAAAKASAMKVPAAMLFGALLFLQAAVNALAVAVFVWLTPAIGPILAGILALVLFAGIAGIMAWVGIKKMREAM